MGAACGWVWVSLGDVCVLYTDFDFVLFRPGLARFRQPSPYGVACVFRAVDVIKEKMEKIIATFTRH